MARRSLSRRSVLEAAVAATSTVALAGCGGDGGTAEDGDEATPTDADTATPTDADVAPATEVDAATATETPLPGPTVRFQFDYDPDAGTVTITHVAGDSVAVSNIYVRGEGFADASDTDMTAAGQWAGLASGEVDGEPAIVSGDSVTVAVTGDDYELLVVWEDSQSDAVSELARRAGPTA